MSQPDRVREDTYHVVAAPLAEESHGDDHSQAVSGCTSVVQLTEIPPWIVVSVQVHLLDNLVHLQSDDGSMYVAICMVLGEDLDGLFPPVFGDEPAGGFWKEEHRDHGNSRHEALNQCWRAPGPGVLQVEIGSVSGPSRKDISACLSVFVYSV